MIKLVKPNNVIALKRTEPAVPETNAYLVSKLLSMNESIDRLHGGVMRQWKLVEKDRNLLLEALWLVSQKDCLVCGSNSEQPHAEDCLVRKALAG